MHGTAYLITWVFSTIIGTCYERQVGVSLSEESAKKEVARLTEKCRETRERYDYLHSISPMVRTTDQNKEYHNLKFDENVMYEDSHYFYKEIGMIE